MSKKIIEEFKVWSELQKGKSLLAVSGGMDSMCLWYLFRKFKIPHSVAHVNYGLRGKESDADESLVRKIAKENQLEVFVKKVDPKTFEKGTAIQEKARMIRYQWFEELIKEHGFGQICTAHHLDDSVETFLINLSRGAGLKGLGGIRSREGLQRPLIEVSRKQIAKFVEKQKIDFRDDSSNFKDHYTRNWIRNKLLKKWKKKDPKMLANAAKSISILRESRALLEKFIEKEIEGLGYNAQLPFGFSLEHFDDLNWSKEVLFHMVEPLGFNRWQIDDLFAAYEKKNSGSVVYSAEYRLILDRNQMIIDHREEEMDLQSIDIPEGGIELEEPFALSVDLIERSQIELGKKRTEYLSADKLQYPLKLRKWKEGDKMQPLGMKGKKKVSDILIDAKVSIRQKEDTYLILSNEEIICLLGHRISDRYKLNEASEKVLRIQW